MLLRFVCRFDGGIRYTGFTVAMECGRGDRLAGQGQGQGQGQTSPGAFQPMEDASLYQGMGLSRIPEGYSFVSLLAICEREVVAHEPFHKHQSYKGLLAGVCPPCSTHIHTQHISKFKD